MRTTMTKIAEWLVAAACLWVVLLLAAVMIGVLPQGGLAVKMVVGGYLGLMGLAGAIVCFPARS